MTVVLNKAVLLAALLACAQCIVTVKTYATAQEGEVADELQGRRRLSIAFDDPNAPKLAWVLSFPGSGAENLIDIIHGATGKTTATNYGHHHKNVNGRNQLYMQPSEHVYEGRPNGPFLFTSHLPLPTTYLPVLSYCAAYCNDCYPGKYIIPRDEFIAGCSTGQSFTPDIGANGSTGEGTSVVRKYDSHLVRKAVVLIRDPYNVIQDRFMHWTHSFTDISHRDNEWFPRYATNAEGFKAYCDYAAVKFASEEQSWYEPQIFTAALGVPCHADMYRYVNWYNHVFESLDFLSIPYDVIYYEDIGNNYEGAETGVLSFLELSPVNNPPNFYPYGDRGFFTTADKNSLKLLIQDLASPTTASFLTRYIS